MTRRGKELCRGADPESLPNDALTAFLSLIYLMMASRTVAVIVIVVLLAAAILLAVMTTAPVRKLIKLFRKRSEDRQALCRQIYPMTGRGVLPRLCRPASNKPYFCALAVF